MKKGRIIWLILSFLMTISLVLVSCGEAVEEEEEEEIVGENWWDKFGEPEHGGTITYREADLSEINIDPYNFMGAMQQHFYETLVAHDWTLDREIWPMNFGFVPEEYWQGLLAESWELKNQQTLTMKIRKGIKWQDKPPVNGRELTAYDVEYHYHRLLGSGSGFTEPNPFYGFLFNNFEQATALDDYTIVFKFVEPSAQGIYQVFDLGTHNNIEAPESVQQELLSNWEDAVGTGPWMLTDFVVGSSVTFDKNPNYWGYDERHPDQQLPYADQLKIQAIPDVATATAALRTGKIDILEDLNWEQAASLQRTNPDLQQVAMPTNGSPEIELRCDTPPFTDINVRKALQMAIDRDLIAETHYGGTIEGTPCGRVSPLFGEWVTPYDQWPKELQEEYSYNPERTRELLAEAGYPQGFKTNIVTASTSDLDLLQIIQAQFLDVGVDMEIKVMDPAAFRGFLNAKQHDQMVYGSEHAHTIPPSIIIGNRHRTARGNNTMNNDDVYEAMIDDFQTAYSPDEARQIFLDADMHVLRAHWAVHIVPIFTYNITQPYLKGYSGEWLWHGEEWVYARLWIDQELKSSMGR